MPELISKHLLLSSGGDFVFHVTHGDHHNKESSNEKVTSLFEEAGKFHSNGWGDVLIFKTTNNEIGILGNEFTGWYSASPAVQIMKLIDGKPVTRIDLLNMRPARGPGYCTITLKPQDKEFIFFFLTGDEKNWDQLFKKTVRVTDQLQSFFNCAEVKITEAYNA